MGKTMARICELLALGIAFTSVLASRRVDSHIHVLPPQYVYAINEAGGDPSGYPTPAWSLAATIESMNQIDTDIGKQRRNLP